MLKRSPDSILERIREYSEHCAVIVEGKKDVEALKKWGIFSVVSINAHGGPLGVIEHLEESGIREIIILTDYDRRGAQLWKRVRELAVSAGILPRDDLRRLLRAETSITYVEDLSKIQRGG